MFYRAGLAVLQDGRLLMVRKRGQDFWAVPGGHSEREETVLETVARELQEELQVAVAEEDVRVLGVFTDRAADSTEEFQLTLCTGNIVGTPSPSNEIEECIWFEGTLPHGVLPPMFVNHVRPALQETLGWQATRDQ